MGGKPIMKRTILMALVLALVGCATAPAAIVTNTYEFLPDESTMVYYGGWGGRFDYSIEGHFQLTVDFDAGIASFKQVDATLLGEGHLNGQSLGDLFHMTELESTYVSDAQIDFLLERDMPTFPGADIHLSLTLRDDSVHMTGSFSEPLVDGPWYDLDAVAVPEPVTLFLVGLGGLMLRRRN